MSDENVVEMLALYDNTRKEKELVSLSYKTLRKNAMKYMNNAENMAK